MSFLKNRMVLGVICVVLSLIICFVVTPLFNAGLSQKASIIRVTKDIKAEEQITEDKVKTVEVGSFNLPENVVKNMDTAIGKYISTDLYAGDYILKAKLMNEPSKRNTYLYGLNGEKQAISVTIKSLANGLSGKLIPHDIVSVIAPDYKKQGATIIPPELQYVEVIATTDSSGYDTDSRNQVNNAEDEEKTLPSTVTLLATMEQSKILAGLEADGKIHLSLVYRGTKENAGTFIEIQDNVLKKLYPKVEETGGIGRQTEAVSEKERSSHD